MWSSNHCENPCWPVLQDLCSLFFWIRQRPGRRKQLACKLMAQPPYVVPLQQPQLHLNCCFCWALEWNPVPPGAVPSPTYSSSGRHPQMLYAGHAADCLSEHSVFQCCCCPSIGHNSGYTACVVLLCCALQLVLWTSVVLMQGVPGSIPVKLCSRRWELPSSFWMRVQPEGN